VAALNITPQEGPQTQFLATNADIAIYGGAAGGGKSFGLLLEPMRHWENKKFTGIIFRRTTPQIRNPGGLWDESRSLYPLFRAVPRESYLEWVFKSGAKLKFSHLEYDSTVHDFQGSQIPFIGFDELVHFTEHQFFYMLSRNRSTSGIPGYIRATTNPDPDSWVRKFIDWWIGKDGTPIKERSGVLRWFIRLDDKLIWADSKDELYKQYGYNEDVQPKSVTFIAATLDDNKILMKKDPSYRANLLAMSRIDRLRLLGGNWDVRASAGMMFQRQWFPMVDRIPDGWIKCVRYWDRAATKPSETNKNPDWTRGVKLYSYPGGKYLVADLRSCQDTPFNVETLVVQTAQHDGAITTVWGEQDPGSAGVGDAQRFASMLAGFDVRITRPSVNKVTRAKPVSAQSEARNIAVLRAPWNDEFFSELEAFGDNPKEYAHDDIVDAFSGAFNESNGTASLLDAL
jgi:predicted phage terminase large subunit-like protein